MSTVVVTTSHLVDSYPLLSNIGSKRSVMLHLRRIERFALKLFQDWRMAVPLTAKDISRLMNAATIMLSPLDFPTGESWVKSVCRALQEVVDADAASELASCFRFSKREIECALLLKNGASSKQIAATMGISVNTARRHVERILLKLNVHSRAAAAAALHSPSSLHRS